MILLEPGRFLSTLGTRTVALPYLSVGGEGGNRFLQQETFILDTSRQKYK